MKKFLSIPRLRKTKTTFLRLFWYVRTHLANRGKKKIRIKHGCSQTKGSELWGWGWDAERSWGKSGRQGCHSQRPADWLYLEWLTAKAILNAVFTFCPFFSFAKAKTPFRSFLVRENQYKCRFFCFVLSCKSQVLQCKLLKSYLDSEWVLTNRLMQIMYFHSKYSYWDIL